MGTKIVIARIQILKVIKMKILKLSLLTLVLLSGFYLSYLYFFPNKKSFIRVLDYNVSNEKGEMVTCEIYQEEEIKKLKDAGWDHGEKGVNSKGGGPKDLWKDKDGNVYEKPKNGSGSGEPIGRNLNNLSVKIGVGAAIGVGVIKVLDWVSARLMPIFMAPPLMMMDYSDPKTMSSQTY